MRIAAIEHVLPARRVTNDWIEDRIRECKRAILPEAQIDALVERTRGYLAAAGTTVRYHLDEHERPLDLAAEAGRKALAAAGVEGDEVDFLIYCGVARGWIEPATAPAIQAALGLTSATAFDVLEACAGWMRALQIADVYLRTGTYRRGLIVNCECGLDRYEDWNFQSVESLEQRIAAFTIGEAATATLVEATPPESGDFYFTFKTSGEHVGLCMIPLQGFELFHPSGMDERLSPGKFFSLSQNLADVVAERIIGLYESDKRLHGVYDICFGHEVSERVCERVTRALGVHSIYFPTHRRYGNTASASVPLGMSTALREGHLHRGSRVLVIVGASGVTVGFGTFTF